MKDKRYAENATVSWREERSLLAGEGELSMKDSKNWLQFHLKILLPKLKVLHIKDR